MKKYKIIIVENDEDERFFMNEGFSQADLFEVLALVPNGDALFDWLKKQPENRPDVILSDLNMPGKNGYDVISEVGSTPGYAHIPVIITSTSSTQTFIDKCLVTGAADYVVKPESFTNYEPFAKHLHALIETKGLVK